MYMYCRAFTERECTLSPFPDSVYGHGFQHNPWSGQNKRKRYGHIWTIITVSFPDSLKGLGTSLNRTAHGFCLLHTVLYIYVYIVPVWNFNKFS